MKILTYGSKFQQFSTEIAVPFMTVPMLVYYHVILNLKLSKDYALEWSKEFQDPSWTEMTRLPLATQRVD